MKEKKKWLELYDLAKEIQKVEPWNYFLDRDILTYVQPESGEMIYYCIMENAGLHKAIGVITEDHIDSFMKTFENDYPPYIFLNYQECILCQYLEREHTLPKNREIIKELDLKFRGEWISFENFERGYEPSPIVDEQLEFMIEALKNFIILFKDIKENNIQADFKRGNTITRLYDENAKTWMTVVAPLIITKIDYESVTIQEPEFEEEIKKLQKTNMELEYEFMNYIPFHVEDLKEDGRYYYPRMQLMAERKSGMILYQNMINKKEYDNEELYIEMCIQKFLEMLEKLGRPKVLYVRDVQTKTILQDICKKAEITIKINAHLKAIDEMYSQMMQDLG